MAVKNKEEILEQLKEKFGDDTSDEALGILEDITDTIDDLTEKGKPDGIDWKAKCEETENAWRQKYHDRFFSAEEPKEKDPVEEEKPLTYEALFNEE